MMSSRTLLNLAGRIVILVLVLLVLQAIGSRFVSVPEPSGDAGEAAAEPAAPPSGGFLALALAASLLQTVALAYPVVRSLWSGWRLTAAIFVVYFGTVTFVNQIESIVYLGRRLPEGVLGGIFLMGLFCAVAFSPILVAVLGRWRPHAVTRPESEPSPRLPLAAWWGRSLLGAAAYTALYYVFGYYVAWKNPAVREFYGGTDPGSFLAQMRGILQGTPWMVPLQLVRGLMWVGLAVLVMRMMRGRWWEAGLAVSMLFTVPVVYLLFPNPLMPEAVRLAHVVETAPYQFLFGWFVVWLFTRPAAA